MIEKLIEYENGGKIEVYKMVDKSANDYHKIYACCEYFAKQGAKTIITPRFDYIIGNPVYENIYASLKGTPYWGKCTDFKVDDIWYEHEGFDETKDLSNPPKRADTFSLMLKRGIKQSDRLVIEDSDFAIAESVESTLQIYNVYPSSRIKIVPLRFINFIKIKICRDQS